MIDFQTIESLIELINSPTIGLVLKGVLAYLAAVWFAIIIWVARDIINRSNNLFVQVLALLLNIVLPVFGLVLYLLLRPSKTLLDKYYEELEYQFLSEQLNEKEMKKSKKKTLSKKPKKKGEATRKKVSSKKS